MQFQTTRLLLREWRADDYKHFQSFFSDGEHAKYVGGAKGPEVCWRLLASYIGHFQMHGYGKMAVEERATGQFVGCAGLWNSEPWPELELGYWFVKEMTGKGYATEAATYMRDYAFKELNVKTLVSYIHPDNTPSKRLAQRLGATYDKTIELLDFGVHEVFRYSK